MMSHRYPNTIEFEVTGEYALFTDPIMRLGGEKCSYPIPTYEALKGVMHSVYWKPTLVWYIDVVRIMNPIQTADKGVGLLKWPKGRDLAYYTYLRNCRYQVQAHFEWNENRPECAADRDADKHFAIAKRSIEKGGRRDVFLGARECQAYVEPCHFGEGPGAYDNLQEMTFGIMHHSFTYPDEAYSSRTAGKVTANFWMPVMRNGVIYFPRPEDCPYHKPLKEMEMKSFERKRVEK